MRSRFYSLTVAAALIIHPVPVAANTIAEVTSIDAETVTSWDNSFDSSANRYASFDDVTDSRVLEKIIPTAKQSAIKDSELEPGETLKLESPVVKQSPEGVYVVTFPISSKQETDIASMTVFLNPDGSVETTYQLSLRQVDSNSGRVQTRVNGKESIDKLVTGSDSAAGIVQPFTIFDWSKVKQCLNNAGVASWVVAGISVVCAAACVGTAGLGCVGCIAAAATVTGATAGHCVGMGLSDG